MNDGDGQPERGGVARAADVVRFVTLVTAVVVLLVAASQQALREQAARSVAVPRAAACMPDPRW